MSNFDISESARQILEEKAKRRAFLRETFLKLKSNPFQHASMEGGAVFDPAVQRYNALKVNGFDYFKPSGKNALQGVLAMVIPMAGYFWFVYTSKHAEEAKYRRGEVAYKDRRFKFI